LLQKKKKKMMKFLSLTWRCNYTKWEDKNFAIRVPTNSATNFRTARTTQSTTLPEDLTKLLVIL
jgi:hypothetical protein